MKYCYPFFFFLSNYIFLLLNSLLASLPSVAAERIIVRYGLFEQSLSVTDIRKYSESQQISADLQSFLHYLTANEQQQLQEILQVKMSLDIAAVEQLTNTIIVEQILSFVSQAIARDDQGGLQALRSAIILGSKSPEGLGIISFLEAYPSQRIVVDLPKALKLMSMSNLFSNSPNEKPQDNLISTPLGQIAFKYQRFATKSKKYSGCLFGDSISAGLGNNLGKENFNFAVGGLSTVSLIQQIQGLIPTDVKCQKAIIAIGANDALYGISEELFSKNMLEVIGLVRRLGAKEIVLIPAFYSTLAASLEPTKAAPIETVERFNALIDQVATTEKLPVARESVAPLYDNNILKKNLTNDGVHLNAAGLNIYRQAILQILGS